MLFPSVAQINLAKLNALQLLSRRRPSNKLTQNQAGSSLRYPRIHRLPGKVALLPSILRVGEFRNNRPHPLCGFTTVQACTATHLVAINQLERRGGGREHAQSIVIQCLGVGEGWGTVHGE